VLPAGEIEVSWLVSVTEHQIFRVHQGRRGNGAGCFVDQTLNQLLLTDPMMLPEFVDFNSFPFEILWPLCVNNPLCHN
jgi:hypothetical protein